MDLIKNIMDNVKDIMNLAEKIQIDVRMLERDLDSKIHPYVDRLKENLDGNELDQGLEKCQDSIYKCQASMDIINDSIKQIQINQEIN